MADDNVNSSSNLENLIKDQANRIGELETHIENMSELFDQKEQTLATELFKMRFLMAEFVKFHCHRKKDASIFPLSIGGKKCSDNDGIKEQKCNAIIESNSFILSQVVENEYSQITAMEDEEEFRCAGTQTDPINSSDDDDEEEDNEELELTMDTVGDLNGIDYHLEYEEITLKRSKNGKRLGLTLCYGNNDEYDTDIFVSEIEKGSIADNDGRIKVGDQILQVNRQTVNSRKEAITQFSMDSNEITIMLARPRLPDNDDSNDEDEEIANVTEADLHQIANCHRTGSTNNAALSPLPENDDGDGQLTENSGFEKDSGLSRATDSDPDLIGLSVPAQTSQTGTSDRALEHELAFLRKEMETIRLECDRLLNKHNSAEKRVAQQVQQATNLMQTIDRLTAPQSPYRQILNSTGTSVTSSPIPQYFPQPPSNGSSQFSPHMGYERRLRHPITNPYHPSGNPHVSVGATIGINGRMRPLQHEETSSAYNTGGDSCRSTPLKGEYAHVIDTTTNTPPRRPIHLTTKERVIEPPLSPNSENQYHTIETPMSNATTVHFRPSGSIITTTNHPPPFPTTSIPKREKIQMQQQQHHQNPQIFYKPGDIMYTSPENLAETIALQQRLLRQAMVDQTHHNKPGSSKNLQGHHGMVHKQNEKIDPAQKYEWKVKRRSDGTCYITRKPLRNQLLKAREEQLNKERNGLSTDDDAASELKTGRFWSREERKRHLERAREKKANKMQIAMQKVAINPSEQMIMQLSNRKQMRRSGRQLFDKFTTLQEFLAHGSRDPSTAPIGGILSVTTV